MTAPQISIADAKGYATEANLARAIERAALPSELRYFICRKPDGKWTAVYLVSEYLRQRGGYVMMAAQHGFTSV